jgi:aminoglycoside 6'-N-acetyltransferase I
MTIDPFPADDAGMRREAAELLVEAFPHDNGWPTVELALEEVDTALSSEHVCLAAIENGILVGWIAGRSDYRDRVWELHPLVVRASARGRGVGRALTHDLEIAVAARGALTMWVGTDDDLGETSLGGVDVYPDPLAHVCRLDAPPHHPVGFYRHVGYALCGIVPDANGRGLPGILLARKVGSV